MTFLFIIKPYMTFLFISSYLVPNFTVYDAVKNQVPKHFYDVPVYDFKYDLPVVFYDFPVKVILRCPRLYDVPVYDVPVYDCNSSYHELKPNSENRKMKKKTFYRIGSISLRNVVGITNDFYYLKKKIENNFFDTTNFVSKYLDCLI